MRRAALFGALALAPAMVLAAGCADEAGEAASREPVAEAIAAGSADDLLSGADRLSFASAYSARGRVSIYERQYEQAVTDFDAAISLAPERARYYTNRALAFAFMGLEDEARRDVSTAIKLGDIRLRATDGPDCRDAETSLADAYSVSIFRAYMVLYMSYGLAGCAP